MLKKGLIIGIVMSAGSLILLFATPWLARAYSPEEFGSLAIFMAVMSLLSSASCLRHDAALLVVPDSKVDPTTQLAFIYVLVCSIFGGVFFGSLIPEVLGIKYSVLKENMVQLVVGTFGGGSLLLACAMSMRREEYFINALIRAIQGPVYVVMALFFAAGLINGWAIGWAMAGITSAIYLTLNTRFSRPSVIWKQAVSLKQYSLRLTPTFLLDSLALALPIFFINFNYSAEEVGAYSQVNRLIGAPLLLISAVIGQILLEKTGKYFRNNQSSFYIFKISVYILIAIASLVLIAVIFSGHYLVSLILGSGWKSDTIYLIIITIPILCKTVVSPITCVFLTHEQTKYVVNWQILYFLTTLIILSLTTILKVRVEIFLSVYAFGEMILYALYYHWAYAVVKGYNQSV